MRTSGFFFSVFRFLLPPAIIGTLYLYLFPILVDCSFPVAKRAEAACTIPGQESDAQPEEKAPFRLLAIGDPQLEGDTSLPNPNAPWFSGLAEAGSGLKEGHLSSVRAGLSDLFVKDVPNVLKGYRKKLDLWGNDLYLAHIYRSVSWWAEPTHTVVLGDLIGSQWIGDEEFERRSERFWNTVFKGAEKVPQAITGSSGRVETIGKDQSWKKRVIAVAGNHDIGYAGDLDEDRVERFEEMYGAVNWEIRFKLEAPKAISLGSAFAVLAKSQPELRVAVLNSMNLDSPAKDLGLQRQSQDFVETLFPRNANKTNSISATLLLSHIPLYKKTGVCTDPPLFDWFPASEGGGIREQNHLSQETSHYLLKGLTDDGRNDNIIVLNGHDHEVCDTYHYRSRRIVSYYPMDPPADPDAANWKARPYSSAQAEIANEDITGIREITVRSMMGSHWGNVGMLSAWYERESKEWKFGYNSCQLGVQHIWWAVHVLDLLVLGLGVGGLFALVLEKSRTTTTNGAKLKTQ